VPEHPNKAGLRGIRARITDATRPLSAPDTLPQDVPRLVADIVGERRAPGGGTLLDEAILVVCGAHDGEEFRIFDQAGNSLGAITFRLGAKLESRWEIRDTEGRNLQLLQAVGGTIQTSSLAKWSYALSEPGSSIVTSIDKVQRRSATCAVAVGPRRVGTLRKPDDDRVTGYLVEDDGGRQLADVRVARTRSGIWGAPQVAIVVQIDDHATAQMRWVALATSVIVDNELLNHLGGGG
jgi:hypothetical protein